ncbi:hypothetical protein FCV25MIE_24783 [Fagus crenata]
MSYSLKFVRKEKNGVSDSDLGLNRINSWKCWLDVSLKSQLLKLSIVFRGVQRWTKVVWQSFSSLSSTSAQVVIVSLAGAVVDEGGGDKIYPSILKINPHPNTKSNPP